jgi:2,3-diaminopropionate biosynthesis protein SbnB
MLYLNESHLDAIGLDWQKVNDVVERAVRLRDDGQFAQPLKPYLRYGDPRNRIIAMPAYLGGEVNCAGLKWIASVPDNLSRALPRAHSVIVLNDAATGAPTAFVNGARLSGIRTAGVSGLMIREFLACRARRGIRIGITGWGPIGRLHLSMCEAILGDSVETVSVFDVRPPPASSASGFASKVEFVRSWRDAYDGADIFITCTVSSGPYIDTPPKPGSLHLNVSLRDYVASMYSYVKGGVVVDDWDEVCRENTDIERMHKESGLTERDAATLADVVVRQWIHRLPGTSPVFFNPMGMAIFDVAIAAHYVGVAGRLGVGTVLD